MTDLSWIGNYDPTSEFTRAGIKRVFKVDLSHNKTSGFKGEIPWGYRHKYLQEYEKVKLNNQSLLSHR
jgi:hypothetical protein